MKFDKSTTNVMSVYVPNAGKRKNREGFYKNLQEQIRRIKREYVK